MNNKYLDSEIDWTSKHPEHWKKEKIFRLCDLISSGGTPKSTNPDFYNGNIFWVQTGDLNDSYITSTAKKITEQGLNKSSAKVFKKGTLLVAMYGATIGKLGIMDITGATNQACCAMQYSNKIDTKFMYYIFLAMRKHLINNSYGGGQPNISQEVIKQEHIYYPTIKEQKSISNYLDNACNNIDKTIKLKEKQIIKINDYYYSTIHETVTTGLDKTVHLKDTDNECIGEIPIHWDISKIKQKYSVIPSSVNKKSKDGEAEVQLCNYTDVYYNDYITNDLDFMIATAKDNECEKFKLNIDDVIITKDSEDPSDIAVPALVKEVQDNLLCGYHLSMIRAKLGNVSGRYLFWLLKDKAIVSQLHREATGITRWAISQRNIKNTIIPNPPLEEQIQIADYLENTAVKVNKVKEKLQAQIDALKKYRKSLIFECVTGKKQIYKGTEGE